MIKLTQIFSSSVSLLLSGYFWTPDNHFQDCNKYSLKQATIKLINHFPYSKDVLFPGYVQCGLRTRKNEIIK